MHRLQSNLEVVESFFCRPRTHHQHRPVIMEDTLPQTGSAQESQPHEASKPSELNETRANLKGPRDAPLCVAVIALMVLGVSVWQGSQRSASTEAHRLVEAGAILWTSHNAGVRSGPHPGAIHIPVHEIRRRSNELGAKDKPIVVYCRSGNRSASATRMLKARGFT